MIRECKQAGIPEPIFKYDSSDISIEFRKDIYNEKHLKTLNLSDRQVKAILFVKDKGKITNSDYQTLNDVSKATATRDLTELTETHKILKRTGDIGVGTNYILIGSIGSNDKNELHILYKNSRQQAHLVTHLHFLPTRKSN